MALCIFASVATAQEERPIEQRLAALYYPKLPRMARVQGDVRVAIESGVPRFVSGPPLLSGPESLGNAKAVAAGMEPAELVLHYKLIDVTFTQEWIEPRGDTFERFLLRLFHISTSHVVKGTHCVESQEIVPPNRADFTRNPIEAWIYGKAVCIEPDAD